MNNPNLDRIVETFILAPGVEQADWWTQYVDFLRTDVRKVISDLKNKKMLGWYSFLLHNRDSGVPTPPDDNRPYIHLRLESMVPINELIGALPAYCVMTRHMQRPDPPSLDTINLNTLKDGRVEEGWRVLGESSEWVLNMLQAHQPAEPVPAQNVGQFLHYLVNQLQAQMLGFREPALRSDVGDG